MTTHYQKIQALGNRMAENLTIMGVPSQFDEGGLTLADKILEISGRVTSGIILYGDKKIAQSEDTVNLYALVLDDNIAVSGETVRFYSDIHLRSETCSQSDSLYDDYYASSSKSGIQYDFIGSNDKYIRYNSTTINIFYGSQWSSDFGYTGEFHIKEGVLTYYDSGGVSHTVDVSMVDTTSINSNPITVYYNWVEVTTGSDGVATYAYTCTGSGLREFYVTSGTFVSETYSIWDYLFYDDGVGGNNTGWTKTNCTANYDSTGTEFIPTANWGSLSIPNSDYYSDMPFVIEFKIVEITGNIRFYYDNSNHYSEVSATGQYRMEVTSSGVTLKKDGTTIGTAVAPVTLTSIAIASNTTSNKCKFKEFKIYPI